MEIQNFNWTTLGPKTSSTIKVPRAEGFEKSSSSKPSALRPPDSAHNLFRMEAIHADRQVTDRATWISMMWRDYFSASVFSKLKCWLFHKKGPLITPLLGWRCLSFSLLVKNVRTWTPRTPSSTLVLVTNPLRSTPWRSMIRSTMKEIFVEGLQSSLNSNKLFDTLTISIHAS